MDDLLSTVLNYFNPQASGMEASSRHRRLRAIILDIPFYIHRFTAGHIIHDECTIGLPEGAKFIGAVADAMALSVHLIFEHDTFAPVPSGQYIPIQRLKYEPLTE